MHKTLKTIGILTILSSMMITTIPNKHIIVAAEETNNTFSYDNDEYAINKEKLITAGYFVEEDKFEYEGLIYTKFFHEDGSYGLIEESSDGIVTYTITPEIDGVNTVTVGNAQGEQGYLRVTENGEVIKENMTMTRGACDFWVGASGTVLSTIYGGAFGLAFGGPAGAIAGATVGMAWIPISSACP